jgi:cytochrome-b5 reductase
MGQRNSSCCNSGAAATPGFSGAAVEILGLGTPVARLAAPGECVLTSEWTACKLVASIPHGLGSQLFTFELPDAAKPLGLMTCACILAKCGVDEVGAGIVRPYTPVSTNEMIGHFNLLIKIYPDGKASQYFAKLQLGSYADFKHIPVNVKLQFPFGKRKIGMIAGGTGLTPMIQALHAILGTPNDDTLVGTLQQFQLSFCECLFAFLVFYRSVCFMVADQMMM